MKKRIDLRALSLHGSFHNPSPSYNQNCQYASEHLIENTEEKKYIVLFASHYVVVALTLLYIYIFSFYPGHYFLDLGLMVFSLKGSLPIAMSVILT